MYGLLARPLSETNRIVCTRHIILRWFLFNAAGFVLALDITKEVCHEKKPNKKMRVIKELVLVPIVQLACKRAGVSRATYYRWLKEDPKFSLECDEALKKGQQSINDLGESKLIHRVNEGDMRAISFWLSNNKENYRKNPTQIVTREATWAEILASVEEARRKGLTDL